MSKKKKFKKKIKGQIHHQLQQIAREESNPDVVTAETQKPIEPTLQPIIPSEPVAEQAKAEPQTVDDPIHVYAKQDTKRIIVISIAMLAILAGIYILSLKTSWIADLSNWLAKILHVS